MNNQYPNLKDEVNRIQVPDEKLSSIITNTINEAQKKKSRKKSITTLSAAAGLAVTLFLGSTLVSPAMANIASDIPIIGSFFEKFGDKGLQIAGQKGLTQTVEQTDEDNGISVTINEVFYDGSRLTLGYTSESQSQVSGPGHMIVKVNGEEITYSSGQAGYFINPELRKGTISIHPQEKLPEEFDVNIIFEDVGYVLGRWEFEFPVKQSNNVTVLTPKAIREIGNAEMRISSLELGPAGTSLNMSIINDADTNNEFDPNSSNLQFHIMEENGQSLELLDHSGHGELVNGKFERNLNYFYTPLSDSTENIRVIPYTEQEMTVEDSEEVSIPLVKKGLPFTLNQGDFQELLITDIDSTDEKVTVFFNVLNEKVIGHPLPPKHIWLEDSQGKAIMSADSPQRVKKDTFKIEFMTKMQNGLKLKTYKYPKPEIYEEFQVEIQN